MRTTKGMNTNKPSFLRSILFLSIITVACVPACTTSPPKLQHADPNFKCVKDLNTETTIQTLEKTAKVSSFLPIHGNHEAYEWRQMLIGSATKTLDVQTFIWEEDETGAYIIERIIAAADRGIKVRLLVDDFLLAGRDAVGLLINDHPNIDIKVFNPLGVREDRAAFRGLEVLFNLSRLNHRMHNKVFVMDNEVAIIGGRNIGNEYYGIGHKHNYRDFDMVTTGPVVTEITDSFEVFWNSPGSYALEDVADANNISQTKDEVVKELKEKVYGSGILKKEFDTESREWEEKLAASKSKFVKGYARVIYDCPPTVEDPDTHQAAKVLSNLTLAVEKELFFISPYLIPSEKFLAGMQTLRDRGVRIRILTNSLESSDSAAAVSGYARYRKNLLDMGIELHELRADAAHTNRFKSSFSTAEFLSLHAKVIIFDRQAVYAGSLNLDPRSIVLNTEVGVLIKNKELAEIMIKGFEHDLLTENSWQVYYNGEGDVTWRSSEVEVTSTPARSMFQRWGLFFYSLLPIEDQL